MATESSGSADVHPMAKRVVLEFQNDLEIAARNVTVTLVRPFHSLFKLVMSYSI